MTFNAAICDIFHIDVCANAHAQLWLQRNIPVRLLSAFYGLRAEGLPMGMDSISSIMGCNDFLSGSATQY